MKLKGLEMHKARKGLKIFTCIQKKFDQEFHS